MASAAVTFLFTDLEGSNRLWERHPQAMRASLARHDDLLAQAMARHGGALVRLIEAGKVLLTYHLERDERVRFGWQSKRPRRSYASLLARLIQP